MLKTNQYLYTLLVTVTLSFGLQASRAQQPIRSGEYTIDSVTYKVTKNEKYSFYSIYRPSRPRLQENRTVVNDIPLQYIKKRLTNESVWKQLVKEVLGETKVKALKQRNEQLDVTFYFKSTGDIIFTIYKVKDSTSLTVDDIAMIDQMLMDRYRGTFSSINDGHQYLYYVYINSEIYFSE